MIDVGQRAGVSAQTVSRFFNGGSVSVETSARIETAVADLGYRHNRLPVQMKSDHTDMVGLLVLGPYNYGATSILAGLGRAARREGQALVIEQFEPDPVDDREGRALAIKCIDHFLTMRVDGLLISSPFFGVDELIDHVRGEVPVMAISDSDADSAPVRSDSYRAAREAVRHLIGLGHRRILHAGGPAGRVETETRKRAYLDEMAAAGLEPLPLLAGQEWDADSGAECARQVDPAAFSAVFAGNDEMALGFVSQMRARGYWVPQDFSIVGFDDMPEARYFDPPLTTVRVDFELVGERAMAVILQRIRSGVAAHEGQVVGTELIVRGSTAASRTAE